MISKRGVISIIVPIYNVDKYLNKCISSIVGQTYKKIEILLIDDGALDSSPAICDDWVKKDNRVKVIHKNNGGLSDARNVGIDNASGEFILFVDGDDYIASNMCEELINAIYNTQSDIALCSFFWEYNKYRKIEKMYYPKCGILTRENVLEYWSRSKSTEYVVAWNKLYHKKIFYTSENIRYPIGRLHEDEFTTYRLLYAAEKMVFVDKPLYFYVQRNNSIMSKFSKRNLMDRIDLVHEYFRWSEKYAPSKHKVVESIAMRSALETVKQMIMHTDLLTEKGKCKELMQYVDEEVNDYLFNSFATKREKVKYLLYCFGLYDFAIKAWSFYKKKMVKY